MARSQKQDRTAAVTLDLTQFDDGQPVLIAGPTASGKSALAMQIAERRGGPVVNADAIQVFANWRVLTARPSPQDEACVPHALYGHVPGDQPYSVGQWLRDLEPWLAGDIAPVIVGGTGLYFTALTEGLADIPQTPPDMRARADAHLSDHGLAAMAAELDRETATRIDLQNPMRVQRAWEVLQLTGRGLASWQADTPPPRLPLDAAHAILFDVNKETLNARIARRFDQMLAHGALEEARANLSHWDAAWPSAKAIGAPELIAHLNGDISLDEARSQATIATRQFAKRQRTWFRARMKAWTVHAPFAA